MAIAVRIQNAGVEEAQFVGPFKDYQAAELWVCDQWGVATAIEAERDGAKIVDAVVGDHFLAPEG